MNSVRSLYGILAEFSEPEPLVVAAGKAREAGYRLLDAYTPFPVEGLSEAVGFPKDQVALLTLCGGIGGGLTGYLMQWYANVIDYPLMIAGRPFNSWPAFIPVTFELAVLGASLSAAVGMLALNRLPKPYHPVFEHPGFVRASKDRFFLCILARDPRFEREATRVFLQGLGSLAVSEVHGELDGEENYDEG